MARNRRGQADGSMCTRPSSCETLLVTAAGGRIPVEPGPSRSAYGFSALAAASTIKKQMNVISQGLTRDAIRLRPCATWTASSAGTA